MISEDNWNLVSAIRTIYTNPVSRFQSSEEDLARARERAAKIINEWPHSKRAIAIAKATKGLRPFLSAEQALAYAIFNARGPYSCFIGECRVDFSQDAAGAWRMSLWASLKDSAERSRNCLKGSRQ